MRETTDKADREVPGGRPPAPWDYYYLRYFVGAVVGAGLLFALWMDRSPRALSSFPREFPQIDHKSLDFAAAAAMLGTAGLAYCYIASAPILLLHAVRFRFLTIRRWWPTAFRVAFSALIVLLVVVGVYSDCANLTPSLLRSSALGILIYVPYAGVMALQLIGLLFPGLSEVRGFYHRLAADRAIAAKTEGVREYVESYRHIREHGNAYLIIIMEVVLAMALYSADNTILLFCLALMWVLPASFAWFMGTWLEFKFPGNTQETPSHSDIKAIPFRFGVLLFGGKGSKAPTGRSG